ncbi:MAG TPA: circularly permuted type 2 ATP-grasp protein, partial [bacterium]|nr:circularly permuted type 2 ATP-grasp protein [bacterium]
MNTSDTIQFYNALVKNHERRIQAVFEKHLKQCAKEKLTFGGRHMYSFLRPNFITLEQYRYIQYVCKILRNAVTKFKNAALENPIIMEQAGLLDRERELVMMDPGYDRLSITARWDSFMAGDELKFVELNAECPAGIAYSDIAAKVYDKLPMIREFKKHFNVEKFTIRQELLNGLLSTYAVWRGNKKNKKPRIAIVDWREVPTFTEFQLFQEFFKSKKLDCIIVDPRDLTYEKGRLMAGKKEIDLVYKRILTNDCVEKPEETKALVQAYRDQNVCMINPFRAKLVHKKSMFAVLTHEKNQKLFNGEELSVVLKHIPWTRMLRDEITYFNGKQIDLLDYVSTYKNNFVIKPNDEYGGKGVCLGMEATDQQWSAVLHEAKNGEHYVVQELVKIPKQPFPTVINGNLEFVDMVVDMDPYAFGPNVEGILTRLSASSLANVTAGGGTTPTFVITKKTKKAKKTLKNEIRRFISKQKPKLSYLKTNNKKTKKKVTVKRRSK